jgi:uncharacterized GH25 family protein
MRHALVRRFGLALIAVASTAPLAAHDFWIEPSSYLPRPGQVIAIRARVGDLFLGDPVPRDPSILEQLVVEDAAGRRPVTGRDGADPAGLLRVASPGLYVVGYFGKPSRVELTAEKFNSYLREEGLDEAVATRTRRRQTSAGARELFTRCAKTLVLVGPADAGQRDRALGCRIELVAEQNPYLVDPGQALPLRLTFDGRPLKGALVVARNKRRAAETIAARSDRDGRVRLVLPVGGTWLVKAVHMVPAPANADADWASYWATLTFDVPMAPASTPSRGAPK